jgi:hypothetical protein
MQKRRETEKEVNIVDENIKDIGKAFGDDTKGRGNGIILDAFSG